MRSQFGIGHVILIALLQPKTSFFSIAIESDRAASRSTFTVDECTSGVSLLLFLANSVFFQYPLCTHGRCYGSNRASENP
jgi:hypothetical protein